MFNHACGQSFSVDELLNKKSGQDPAEPARQAKQRQVPADPDADLRRAGAAARLGAALPRLRISDSPGMLDFSCPDHFWRI